MKAELPGLEIPDHRKLQKPERNVRRQRYSASIFVGFFFKTGSHCVEPLGSNYSPVLPSWVAGTICTQIIQSNWLSCQVWNQATPHSMECPRANGAGEEFGSRVTSEESRNKREGSLQSGIPCKDD